MSYMVFRIAISVCNVPQSDPPTPHKQPVKLKRSTIEVKVPMGEPLLQVRRSVYMRISHITGGGMNAHPTVSFRTSVIKVSKGH